MIIYPNKVEVSNDHKLHYYLQDCTEIEELQTAVCIHGVLVGDDSCNRKAINEIKNSYDIVFG